MKTKELNPKKYIDQFLALEEAAKNEIIELLKNNPNGRFIQPNEHDEDDTWAWDDAVGVTTGDSETILLHAVGLFDDDELQFKAHYLDGCYAYNNDDWFTPDQFTHPYCVVYEFVVNYLDKATMEQDIDTGDPD